MNVPILDRFGIKFKAQRSEIGKCRNPNYQKFQFRCFPDFERSDFGIPLFIGQIISETYSTYVCRNLILQDDVSKI